MRASAASWVDTSRDKRGPSLQNSDAEGGVPWDRNAWLEGWRSAEEVPECQNLGPECIEGELPRDMVGTFYRNGPGLFEVGGVGLKHPWDGDGLVAAFSFPGDGSVLFRSRFVRTAGYLKEQRAVKAGWTGGNLYRGTFGTQKPGGWLANFGVLESKNVANTAAVHYGGRLLALWEGGLPHELDPAGLQTVGATRLGGTLPRDGRFTAHPRIDSNTGRLVGFGSYPEPGLGGLNTRVVFYEYGPDWSLAAKKEVTLEGFGFFHDFGVTETHYVLYKASLAFDPVPFLLGFKSAGECIAEDPSRPSQLHLIPRPGAPAGAAAAAAVDVPGGGFVFHLANAFGPGPEGGGDVVVDVVRTDRLETGAGKENAVLDVDFDSLPPSRLERWTLRPAAGGGPGWDFSVKELSRLHQEFPATSPARAGRRHRYVYSAAGAAPRPGAAGPLHGLLRVDAETGAAQRWVPPPHEFADAPHFVPRRRPAAAAGGPPPAEDDGYLLSVVTDGRPGAGGTYLAVLDAGDVGRGPVCRVRLGPGARLPYGLHGCWAEGVVPTAEQLRRGVAAGLFRDKGWNEVGGGLSML